MRFGVIKTLVENKLIKSFVDKKLVKDMKLFESKILKDKSFARLYFIYDTLKENKSLDKETAIYMIDDLVSESKNLKISDKTIEEIVNDMVREPSEDPTPRRPSVAPMSTNGNPSNQIPSFVRNQIHRRNDNNRIAFASQLSLRR